MDNRYMNEQKEMLVGMIFNFFDEKGMRPCIANGLADHLIDGGTVVMPCQLDKPIYFINDSKVVKDIPCKVERGKKSQNWEGPLLFSCEDGFAFCSDEIGTSVFLTEEEAKAALNRLKNGNENRKEKESKHG